jgi:hypothetical protein
MQKIFIKPLIILLLSMLMTACQKGANDPFISFKSRDSRIRGNWTITNLSYSASNTTNISGTSMTETTTMSYNNGMLAVIDPHGDVTMFPFSIDLTIEKNGTCTQTITEDGTKTRTEGYWYWLNDTKNKTRIAFDFDPEPYLIDRLTDKEMIIKREAYSKITLPQNGQFTETKTSLTLTFKKI